MWLARHESDQATSDASCPYVYGAAPFGQRTFRRFVAPKEPTNTPGAYFEVMMHAHGTDFIWSEDGVKEGSASLQMSSCFFSEELCARSQVSSQSQKDMGCHVAK